MAKTEWFRRVTWSAADQADFRARLDRSRTAIRKAQYLRIQAWHLQEVGTPHMYAAALELLDELLRTYPDDVIQRAQAHTQRAECLCALNRPDEAIAAYRAALAAERGFSNVRGQAYLGFAELVLSYCRRDLYAEALAVLDEFGTSEPFPILQYRSSAARAFLYDAMSEPDLAAGSALRALNAAAQTESPFRYHRRLGLVDHPEATVQARLWKIAGRESRAAT